MDLHGDYCTTDEAAKILGLTPGRVRHFISDGRLTSRKIGDSDSRAIHLLSRSQVLSFRDKPHDRRQKKAKKIAS